MSVKYTFRTGKLFFAVIGVLLTLSSRGWAAGCTSCSRCQPSEAVFHSPFYGYYRTCWRPWPGGQPPCPCYTSPKTAAPPAPTRTPSELPLELLPPPRLEEPEDKGQ
jgi:hypothetical protein